MARKIDGNGWFESRDNPILTAGIFEYIGKKLPGAPDPDKVYRVWRPEEELEDPECAESFKLLPWIDDHPPGLLGDEEEGFTPAEDKGVQGTIGESVYYDQKGVLRGNIKLFSSSMSTLVDEGKKELSPGYRAQYEWSPGVAPSGVAKGQPYDVIQRKPRGNHLASVDEGRQGPSVAVLDAFTLDSKDFIEMNEDENKEYSPEEAMKLFISMLPGLQKLLAAGGTADNEDDPEGTKDNDDPENKGTADNEDDPEGTKDSEDKPEGTQDNDDPENKGTADNEDDKTAVALDAMDKQIKALKRDGFKDVIREVARRDQLVKRLSPVVGTFDAADMTTAEVAKYGVKKLGITAPKGQEMAYLDGYLNGVAKAPKAKVVQGTGLDSADANSPISKYLTGSNK
ncbi:DUF2213 domain-containing protein [Serratia fonticola]|uniref:DUF2213 domain-containing protein n=1 Tax=Serratia fonticola TaxID=47917 RepID=A0AAW3WKD1_SERFO|nr:DUF2213 domain-containing protein [Serratia fonticola]MBC3211384.1 DUF2213 domain-containing protein [Serratia fonticola]NYA12366.1 DUF2213 domain-containing protein [Serratia fonticola]NYA31945.1 DUF2213 domain-containing protein [Serratia fonticola]